MKQTKGKPLRHKEGNTFAVKSFNARIADIAVDLRQQLQIGVAWKPSGDECFLSETSIKWSDLNRTRHYADFSKEVRSKVQNYALVVHNKDEIAECLQRHLKVENSLALEPLLDFVVNLAKDIQDDFYPYFDTFFRIFFTLLSTQDAEVIEWVFSALAKLFRILRKPMVKHFEAVFNLVAELMDESTKPYISRFATESFAFLIRSFRDPSAVIDFLLIHCKKYPNLAPGIGELMFEAVKNINHTLHSFFDKFYAILLDRLRNEGFSESSIHLCISTMTEHLGKFLTKETSHPFWTALLKAMNNREQPFSPYYFLILSGIVESKRGALTQELHRVVDALTDAIALLNNDNEETSEAATNCAALILEFVHLNVDLQHRRKLARTVLSGKVSAAVKLRFVEQVVDIPMFEIEVLPHLLDFCIDFCELNPKDVEAVMKCLTTLLLRKDSRQFQPSEIKQWKPLMLDFGMNSPDMPASVVDSFVLPMLLSVVDKKEWSELWSLLVILPHVRPRVSEKVIQRIFKVASLAKSRLLRIRSGEEGTAASKSDDRVLCQDLYVSTVAFHELTPMYDDIPVFTTLEELLLPLAFFGKDVSFLSTLCCVLQTQNLSSLNSETKNVILKALKPNLRNSSHTVRRLSLEVLVTCFSVKESKAFSVFQTCLQAEKVEASIQEYREKLRFLRMLDAEQVQTSGILDDPDLNDVPILYLFGCLKIGFQLVWKEIRQLIASYRSLLSKSLWPVLEAELELVSDEAESGPLVGEADHESNDGSLLAMMRTHLAALTQTETNALNPFKYRIQLWQAVLSVSDSIEKRNRCFSSLFQRFMRNEFIPATLLGTLDELKEKDDGKHDTSRKSRTEAEETCVTMLELFAAFRNPVAVYQEPVVRGYFLDLLTYRSPKVQSAALRCLFNYKWPYLQAYEAHLMKLLDDKDMWNTLTEIEFGASTPVIAEDHRPNIMPIILRILFGRMQMTSKSKGTDKATPKGRKNAIVRALANCRDDEFQYFLDLVLQPCKSIMNSEVGSVDESAEVHLKLADGILHTLFVILDVLRSGLGQSLHRIYQAVVGLLAVVRKRLGGGRKDGEEGQGDKYAGGLLKKLRKECYKCLTKFCSVYPSTFLSDREKEAMFLTAVWPEIDAVMRDGPLTVTPLMRLFFSWSQITTYHAYFSMATGRTEENVLVFLVHILEPSVASRSASIKLVIDVFNNLLYPQLEVTEDEKEEEVEDKTLALREQGLKLLKPCVNTILEYLHDKIKNHLGAKKVRKGSPLNESDLKLAVGVSDMILDADQSEALSDILLRLLSCAEIKKEKDLLGLLEIEKRLVLSINPARLAKSVRPLISMLSRTFTRDARIKICDTLSIIADRRNTDSARELANTANDLLSWSVRHVEEPDYERRGAAYQVAKKRIIAQRNDMEDLDLPLLVLHVADYDIRQSTDIMSSSLRDFGLMCVLTIVRCYGSTEGGVVVLQHVTTLTKEALKSRVESVRNAYVAVLGEVVDFYPKHALFGDLLFLRYPLSLKGNDADKCGVCSGVGLSSDGELKVDEKQIDNGRSRCKCYNQELDVFENLRHIQKHRVGAAIHELAVWTAAKALPVSTAMQLFMPLATAHLCNDQYTSEKYQGLISAVIELVGAVCAVIPWNKYEPMLKHFLSMLTRKPLYHKQTIRVVVAIVDSFHFDLSSVDVTRNRFKSREKAALVGDIDMGDLPETEDVDVEMEENIPPVEAETPEATQANAGTKNAKAEKVYRSLMHFILPGLSKLITDRVAGDESHKLTADLHVGEKEEILRAPVALAIVKLLQKMPDRIIRRQISGVFLKIGRLLKSRLLSIRQSARETLTEIMISLGPSYLPTLIKELRGVLQRGYQIHVLVHCVHMLLTKMLPQLKSGSLDRALNDLVQICHNEMFGELAEEKEVTALTRKIAEARNIKSYDTYAILARFVSPTILLALIKPLKDKAEEVQSHKIAVKLEKALRQILSGLMRNEQLTEKDLLLFCYALHDPSTGLFQSGKPKKMVEVKAVPEHLNRPDSYLIQAEPGRSGPMPVVNRKTNDYLLHNFGLQLLLSCFKSGRLAALLSETTEMLDPFVPLVIKCISSSHIPIRTSALRCFVWMLKFKLPSLESEMNTVVKQLFVHLKNYSGPGAAVAENAEFVTTVYKALSTTVREATFYQLSDKHLKVLLTYADNDFREGTKHILAANLLRAVLSRHLLTAELREIMLNIASVSIQSEQENLREECRQLVMVFLTTYHAKKIKAKEFVELYQDNLEYSMEYGRLICMAVLCDILFKMGEGFQKEYALTFFQLFAARLSDESSTVRQNAAKNISLILHIKDNVMTGEVAKWIKRWISDKEGAVRRIGLQVASVMVETEKEAFLPRLSFVLPSLEKILSANEIALTDEAIVEKDHLLINALNLLAKILEGCGNALWEEAVVVNKLKIIFASVQELLLHEHEWVRIKSMDIFWNIFQLQSSAAFSSNVIFAENTVDKLRELTKRFTHMLKSYSDRGDYYQVWSSCVLYIVKVVMALPQGLESETVEAEPEEDAQGKEEGDDEAENDKKRKDQKLTANFIVRCVCREAVYEALHEPRKRTKRLQVVKWIHRLSEDCDKLTVTSFLPNIAHVLYRCSNEPSAQKDEELKRTTEEVCVAVESRVGREAYASAMRDVIVVASKKRTARKRQQAVEPVLHPEKAARKRIKKQQTKKEARKRKLEDIEVGRAVKPKRAPRQ